MCWNFSKESLTDETPSVCAHVCTAHSAPTLPVLLLPPAPSVFLSDTSPVCIIALHSSDDKVSHVFRVSWESVAVLDPSRSSWEHGLLLGCDCVFLIQVNKEANVNSKYLCSCLLLTVASERVPFVWVGPMNFGDGNSLNWVSESQNLGLKPHLNLHQLSFWVLPCFYFKRQKTCLFNL